MKKFDVCDDDDEYLEIKFEGFMYVWLTIVGAEIAETIKLRKIGLCIYIISVYSFINILLFYSTEKIHFALFNINFNIILQ